MELEHENPVVREFGPDTSLLRRRILGVILIALVLGFLTVVVVFYGSDGSTAFFGNATSEGHKEDGSIVSFAVKAGGLALLACIVPWLATRRWKR
ncbi:MAG: hypothetical protein KIT00_05305 [Rhodospirillales bacterium]|nr:hypothetical protein [Rhodospirillales bacterium]